MNNDALRIAEIVKGRVYHVRERNDRSLSIHEYTVSEDGMYDPAGSLFAIWSEGHLVRVDGQVTRFRLIPQP